MTLQNTDTLAFIAHHLPVEMHDHYALQLVMSLDEPFATTIGGQHKKAIQGFLVDAHVPHACDATHTTVLIMSVDANTRKGEMLKHLLYGQPFVMLDAVIDEATHRQYREAYRAHDVLFDPFAVLAEIGDEAVFLEPPDTRVLAAMEYVARNIEQPLRLPEIADALAISESRLRHLFVRDAGIPLRSYVLWSRIKVALNGLVVRGMSLGNAALHAGFADHAHFTRTFRRMFGVSPSLLLKHSQFLRVFGVP